LRVADSTRRSVRLGADEEPVDGASLFDGEGDDLSEDDVEPATKDDADLATLIEIAERLATDPKKDPKLKKLTERTETLLHDGFSPIVFCRFISTAEWVGDALRKAFAPKINANWRAATNHLVGNRRIKEDFKTETWAPGAGLDNVDVRGWPEGRAQFVLAALAHVFPEAISAGLPAEDQIWLDIRAA
jgi:hypothetical protein